MTPVRFVLIIWIIIIALVGTWAILKIHLVLTTGRGRREESR